MTPTSESPRPIAFLGTGLLGAGFVRGALARGETVSVWNRTAAKAEALRAAGARPASSPADAVREAARVHLVLSDDAAVDAVIDAARAGLAPDALLLDHTTTHPTRTARRAARLRAEGIAYLHCPVFINPTMAAAGRGTILAAGDTDTFERARPHLERQADRVVFLGERADRAAVYKLCGNALIAGITGLMADVFAIAGGAGITPDDALQLFDFYDPSGVFRGRGRRMADGDFTASFELTMARKDVRLMQETAAGVPLVTLDALAARMDAMIAAGAGSDDLAVLGRAAVTRFRDEAPTS